MKKKIKKGDIWKDGRLVAVNTIDGFNIGDTVSFLRQAVGYETKMMEGKIIEFNYSENILNDKFWVACIKSDECEYGQILPYNNTIGIRGLKLIK